MNVERKENDKLLNQVLNKYEIKGQDKKDLLKIIKPIYEHTEFQKRMSSKFPHHGNFTLGYHILEDSVIAYRLAQKYLDKHPNSKLRLDLVVKISMLHDLYTIPWQNNEDKKNSFVNKHGFRHSIESVINSIIWFPRLFDDLDEAYIIIDGIIHHMFPLPVRVYNNLDGNKMELNNFSLIKRLPNDLEQLIIKSTKRKRIGRLSFAKSCFKEGRIMAKADKMVSFNEIKNFSSLTALLTGYNKSIMRMNKRVNRK